VATAVLAWVLVRFGGPALAVLERAPSLVLLAGFAAVLAADFVVEAWRWAILIAGLGPTPSLATLVAYRAAGHTIAGLVPSARLGGEPLRAYLLVRSAVPAARAIATVGVDRSIEMGVGAPFAVVFAVVLLQHGIPALGGAAVTLAIGAVAIVAGVVGTLGRLRRGAGLVSTLATSTGIDRLRVVADRMDAVRAAEEEAGRLVAQDGRLAAAVALSLVAIGLVFAEYHLLLAAFALPAGPLAIVAAIFATGAARSLPVPAGVAVLEGAQMWMFGVLGHGPDVGLAVGLAVRLRELGWTLPGAAYLVARGLVGAARRSGSA
jgi:glycosyltransferase 2 family protein